MVEAVLRDLRRDLRPEPHREGVLVGHEHAIRSAHAFEDRLLVPRNDRPQVDHLYRTPAFLCQGVGHGLRLMHRVTPSHHGQVGPAPARASLAERNQVVLVRLRRAGWHGAVEALVLEEDDGVVHARGGLDQALGILGARRVDHVPAGYVGEEALDVGRVPRAALDVAADRDTADHRTAPRTRAAPAHRSDFVAHLHEGRPDVVGELDLDHGHVAGRAHAARDSENRSLRQGGIHATRLAEFVGDAFCHAEDAALGILDVLSPHDDLGIATHLLPQSRIDRVHHRYPRVDELGLRLLCDGQVRRENVLHHVIVLREWMSIRLFGGSVDFILDRRAEILNLGHAENVRRNYLGLDLEDRVTLGCVGKLFLAAVLAVIVRG